MPRDEFKTGKGVNDLLCYKCHKKGHKAVRCPNVQQLYSDATCLGCRQKGHGYQFCPLNPNIGNVIKCYTCGGNHASRNCTKKSTLKKPDEIYRYAECFICKNVGHLASQCPDNEGKSIYPRGGSCHHCGEVTHLAKFCPNKTEEDRFSDRLVFKERSHQDQEKRKYFGDKDDDQFDLNEDEGKEILSKKKIKEQDQKKIKSKRKAEKDDIGVGLAGLAQELSQTVSVSLSKNKKRRLE